MPSKVSRYLCDKEIGDSLMSIDVKKKRIVVTGGAGFLGRFVCNKLKDRGYKNIFALPEAKIIIWLKGKT